MNYSELNEVDGLLFEKLVIAGANELHLHIKEVNDLNVFPIPDGDTGDNMYRTIEGGIQMMKEVDSNLIGEKAKALSRGMLLNARGNSGVILSQLFKGLGAALKGKDVATVEDISLALSSGVVTAYKAVQEPVEGTMLTVSREASTAVEQNIEMINDIKAVCETYMLELEQSLRRTPELLYVLKEAGVVDSGGAGIFYIVYGIKKVLDGDAATDQEFSIKEETADLFKVKKELKKYGTLVVANGEGLKELFKELGADYVLEGGEGNNTSIKDFINGFNEVNAKDIYVFPNDSNIFMAVKQAASMVRKYNIHLIKTRNAGEIYSALSMLDYSSDSPEEIEQNFIEAFADVTTCLICKSIRDTKINEVEIKTGDYFGFTNKLMLTASPSLVDTFKNSLERLDAKNKDLLTIIYGKSVDEDMQEKLRNDLQEVNSNIEFYEIPGLQDNYDIIFIIE